MPSYVYIRPNGEASGGTNWTIEAGDGASVPGTRWAAVGDLLPSMAPAGPGHPWTRITCPAFSGAVTTFNLATHTLEATQRCRRVRVISYGQTEGATLKSELITSAVAKGAVTHSLGKSRQDLKAGPWVSTDGTDAEWLQADIDALQIKVTPFALLGLGRVWVYDLAAHLEIINKPVPMIISPAQDSSAPGEPVRVTWNQPQNPEAQKKYHVRVFKAFDVESGTFNINTTPPLINRERSSAAQFVDLPSLGFGDDYYYVYLRIATDFNGEDWWSDWTDGRKFKVQSPPTATITSPTEGQVFTLTAGPDLTWVYDDVESNPQSFYRALVFEEPGGGFPANFDPDTELAVWDSDWLPGQTATLQLPDLKDGTSYRVYLKVAQSLPVRLESEWVYKNFSLDFRAPLVPTVSAVQHTNVGALTITPTVPGSGNKRLPVDTDSWVEMPDKVGVPLGAAGGFRFYFSIADYIPDANEEIFVAGQGDWGSPTATDLGWALYLALDVTASFATHRFKFSMDGTPASVVEVQSDLGFAEAEGTEAEWWVSFDDAVPTQFDIGFNYISGSTSASVVKSHTTDAPPYFDSSAPIVVGKFPGFLRSIEVFSSVDAWGDPLTKIGGVDFTALAFGATSHADAWGNTWTFVNTSVQYLDNPNPETYDVERSVDGGDWEHFRYSTSFVGSVQATSEAVPAGTGVSPVVIYDHEIPFKKNVLYRARGSAWTFGKSVASAFSATDDLLISLPLVYMKSIVDTSIGGHFRVQDRWLSKRKRRNAQTYEPIGRKKPVVLKQVSQHDRFSVSLLLLDEEMEEFEQLVDSSHTLFVQSPKGSWLVEIVSDVSVDAALWDDLKGEQQAFQAILELQEVSS